MTDALHDPDDCLLASESEWDAHTEENQTMTTRNTTGPYELWALLDGQVPEFMRHCQSISEASLRMATLLTTHDSKWTFWVQRPDRMSQDNPEGIDLYDRTVLCAARDLAQSSRRRRVRGRVNVGTASLKQILDMSLMVTSGKAVVAKNLPTADQLANVHSQLRHV